MANLFNFANLEIITQPRIYIMKRLFTTIPFLLLVISISAQKKMRVERGDAVNKMKPVWNIHVDKDNQKWVGNAEGLYKILSVNNSVKEPLRADEWALLQYRSGNANLRVSKSDLKKFIPNVDDINTAHLDEKKQHLWVGTTETGLYQFSLSPLTLIKNFTRNNSELETNFINFIEIEPSGRMWIGTPEGIVWGRAGRWNLDEKYLNFVGIAFNDSRAILVSEEWMWEVTPKNKWKELELRPQQYKGLLIDAAIDSKGGFWLASEIISRLDIASGDITPFAAPEYYTSEFASKIVIDQDDALWVGTRDKGLFVIGEEDAIFVSAIVAKPITCGAFEYDGELSVVIEGGTPPYTYTWNDTKVKGDRPGNLGPGEYTVTVSDSKGVTKAAAVAISDPAVIVSIQQEKPESGIGAGDAVASAKVEGGVPDYQYKWDNGETTETAEKLTGGTHTLTVTDDAGCSNTATVEIQQNIADLALSIKESKSLNCANSKDGGLEVTVAGGKPPYQFQWSNEKAKGEQPMNLSAGKYALTVSDASGKSSTAQFTLAAPEILMVTVSVDAPASTGGKDGKATVKPKGGKAPYAYSWDTGESNATAQQLGAGNHEVVVTDANGCTTTAGFTIDENILPLAAELTVESKLKCATDKSAALLVTTKGGKPPYNFAWKNELSGENPTGLGAGNYEVVITDASGKSKTLTAEIKSPEALTGTVDVMSSANTGKKDGKAKTKIKGGKGKYIYAWDNGEKGKEAKQLGAGTHNLTVTDENGCTLVLDFEVTEDILPLSVKVELMQELNCFGDQSAVAMASINGGKGPFTYQWNGTSASNEKAEKLAAGKYELVVKDATGTEAKTDFEIKNPDALDLSIDVDQPASTDKKNGQASAKVKGGKEPYTYAWENGEKDKSAKGLGAGKHTLTVTDKNGCTTTAEVEITEDILPLSVAVELSEELNCYGDQTGAAIAAVKGGKGPFTYQWKGSDATTKKAEKLAAGKYELIVKDATGTEAKTDFELKSPDALNISISVDQPASANKKDGKATAKITGGKSPYTYTWDNGEKTASATGLGAGSHTVDIKDANGCTSTASIEITEDIIPLSITLIIDQPVSCHGDNTGVVSTEVKGGKSPFTYKWSNGQTGAAANKLTAGKYTVEIEDASGGKKTASVTIPQPEPVGIELKKTPAASEVSKDGKVKANGVGGSGDYTFTWSTGATGPLIENLEAGKYQVSVADANGCKSSIDFDLKNKQIPDLTASTLQRGQTVKLEKLYFEADSSSIQPESVPTLEELFEFLTENGSVAIEIGGHTNNIPPHEFCDRLSQARAKAVADYIVSKGINPKRVLYKGYGKRKPKFTNKTKEGREKNQRVEVKVLSI